MSEISGGITLRRSGAGPAQQSERGRPNFQTDQGSCKRRISARRSRPGAGAGGRGAAAAAAGCASAATSSFLLPKGHMSLAANPPSSSSAELRPSHASRQILRRTNHTVQKLHPPLLLLFAGWVSLSSLPFRVSWVEGVSRAAYRAQLGRVGGSWVGLGSLNKIPRQQDCNSALLPDLPVPVTCT